MYRAYVQRVLYYNVCIYIDAGIDEEKSGS